jgi:3-hydroxyisobutyryl-CoA hydrolase
MQISSIYAFDGIEKPIEASEEWNVTLELFTTFKGQFWACTDPLDYHVLVQIGPEFVRNTIPDPVLPFHPSVENLEVFVGNRAERTSGRHCMAIELNARHSDNAFDAPMLERFRELVYKYATNNVYYSVMWKPTSDHLCTGLDLYAMYRMIHESGKMKPIRDLYKNIYQISYYLATLDKPFLPILNGDVAGLGSGIATSAVFPVATESSRISQPGCRYGSLGAEGGALFKFSRLAGRIGEYLLLSGKTLHSSDLVHVGLATHFMPSDRAALLEGRLAEVDTGDVPTLLNAMAPFMESPEESTIFKYIDSIDRCFSKDTVAEIIEALREETEHVEWAQNTLKAMELNSPLAMAITLRATRIGRYTPLLGCLNLEYAIMSRLIQHPEFEEGISAFVESRSPNWVYALPEDVPHDVVESFLHALPIRQSLRLEKIRPGVPRLDGASEVERFLPLLEFPSMPEESFSDQYGGPFAELDEMLTWAHAEMLKPAGVHVYHSLLNYEDEVLESVEELESDEIQEIQHSSEG